MPTSSKDCMPGAWIDPDEPQPPSNTPKVVSSEGNTDRGYVWVKRDTLDSGTPNQAKEAKQTKAPTIAANATDKRHITTLDPSILNAYKDPFKAKTIRLTLREVILLISEAYQSLKKSGDINTSHLHLYSQMFTPQGILRDDLDFHGEQVTCKRHGRIAYVVTKNLVMRSPEMHAAMLEGRVARNVAGNKEVIGAVVLLSGGDPPRGGESTPLEGLSETAFDVRAAFEMVMEEAG